jgi:drug/metabolite transporter (DMT)-like permease
LTPVALGSRRAELRTVGRGGRHGAGAFCVLAGLALAAHFGTWMPSVQLGSVATAAALVATQPVWQGVIAAAQGRPPSWAGWLGIALAVAGAAWATGADFGVSHQAVLSDILALIGGMAGAVYTALGERARTQLSTTTYTWICYGTCAVVLLVVCLAAGIEITGYPATTWAAILAIVVGAQLLGHSMMNYALHHISATTISVVALIEVPGAALLAWAWLGQEPRLVALPGLAMILLGVVVVVLLGGRARRTAADPAAVGSGSSRPTASLADPSEPTG